MLAFNSKSQDCAKHVRVRAGPPLSRAMIRRCEMSSHFSASRGQCQYISLVVLVWKLVSCVCPMLFVLAELVVCSTRGFACFPAKWFWPTVMSSSLTYGSPEAS